VNIAILGGTFDPIHNAHLTVARAVIETFDVDEFHFVPAFTPPHKPGAGITSPFHRFAMVALAASGDARFLVSAIEADTLERRFSADTLRQMREAHAHSRLLFVTGTDMYGEIESWKDYRDLFRLSNLAVAHRPGYPMREGIAPFRTLGPETPVSLGETPAVYYLPWLDAEISSTGVREAASGGHDLSGAVPDAVAAYIRRHGLYRNAN
jgi:nicotinate-nucleotide adenylyltransferase